MPNIAAIDIGSNAIRMIVASAENGNSFTVISNHREALRLGRDVFSSGSVSPATLAKAEEVFCRFRKILDENKVKACRAVATSAMREAINRREIIDRISKVSDISITIIDGQEEARLVGVAVAGKVNLDKKFALLIDIGGGSIEISLSLNGDIISSDSVNMGTVRLLQLLEEKERGPEIFSRMVRGYAQGLKRQLRRELGKRTVDICVGTGGNVEALGNLRRALFNESDGSRLKAGELDTILGELQRLSYEQRMEKFGLKPDRADVIVPAAIVLQQVIQQAGAKEILIPAVGLKEGVLLDLIPEVKSGKSPGIRRNQVVGLALELGRKFSFDEDHGLAVARFALSIFEQTAELHRLQDEDRMLLEIASILHDIGQCISIDGHHKHSHYILRSTNFVGLNNRQKNIVACTARYHRKAHPKMEHPEFAALPADDRQTVKKLASIIRIAEALDREHLTRVKSLKIDIKKSKVALKLEGDGDLLLEKLTLKSRTALFEETYATKIQIEE